MKPAMTQAERDVVVFAMSQMADLSHKDWRDHGFRLSTFERAGQKIRNFMDSAVRAAPVCASGPTCPHCGKPLIKCKCWGEVQKVWKEWSRTRLDVHDDRFAMIAIDNIFKKVATQAAPAAASTKESAS